MGKLFLQMVVSVDGYIEDETGSNEWQFIDADFEAYIDQTLLSIDGMIFGRIAFEQLATFWPTADPADTSPTQVRAMHELPKYVLSNSLDSVDWHNSKIISGDIGAAITKIKSDAERDIALFAGASAARSCAALGLIDEYRLIIDPIQLGGGKRLFDSGFPRTRLALEDVRRFASGGLVLSYRPQG